MLSLFEKSHRVLKNIDTNILICYITKLASGNNSVVECNLAKVEVAGPNPVSRSKEFKGLSVKLKPFFFVLNLLHPFLHPFCTRLAKKQCAPP
jgi:hypothetical protein